MLRLYFLFLNISFGYCVLWPQGIVHFAINPKDYDVHSQDIILSTLQDIEKEICVKFFNTPINYSASEQRKILYISNPDKRKSCPPDTYFFNGSVVDMPIGYKCLNRKDITRIVVAMLKASIEQPVDPINSYDLVQKYHEMDEDPNRPTLLTPNERNYINSHYYEKCHELSQQIARDSRRNSFNNLKMSVDNMAYYADKLWPFGIVMYGVEAGLRGSPHYNTLKFTMSTIELISCLVFQEMDQQSVLEPRSLVWFASEGSDVPQLGRVDGNQTIRLKSMVEGTPGHTAHTLNLLLRILGVPMMSNRYDRDNYVNVRWKNIVKGKEHLLEKTPVEAWLSSGTSERAPYDFDSVTHAPANYLCADCGLNGLTVVPHQDHLWQRTMSMGHGMGLSMGDTYTLFTLYNDMCRARYATIQ